MNTTQGPAPIEFWFDFASGYAYFAALEIEALAERHGRNVLWRPFALGAAFKVTGAQGLSRTMWSFSTDEILNKQACLLLA